MLDVVKQFQQRHTNCKPIIVADAAMLSQENMQQLESKGYQYIVGAMLRLPKRDGDVIRLPYLNRSYDVICAYSEKRAKKDRREFDKQMINALEVISNRTKWQKLGKLTPGM